MNMYSNQRTSQSSVFAKRSSVLHLILTWGSWPGLSSSIHAKFLIAALFVAGNTSNWDFCSSSLHLGFLCFLFTFHVSNNKLSQSCRHWYSALLHWIKPLNEKCLLLEWGTLGSLYNTAHFFETRSDILNYWKESNLLLIFAAVILTSSYKTFNFKSKKLIKN